MPLTAEFTTFTLDTLGRGIANTLDEALHSAGVNLAGFGPPPADARPFDVIIIGGGTFGSVLAQHLLFIDRSRSRRILVLEAGPFVLPEHVQNLPFIGYGLPDFVQPWLPNPPGGPNPRGLRMCLGGRSLEWGGWSPQPLDAELAVGWPAGVVSDLNGPVTIDGIANQPGYFAQAADQVGAEDTNDFIYGPFHNALRASLRNRVASAAAGTVVANLSLGGLPNPLAVLTLGPAPAVGQLRELLGLPSSDTTPRSELIEQAKLEAPLAVQSRNVPGLFPINKFSALPLLIAAARSEADASLPYDQLKRLLVVPGWHVQDIETQTQADNSVHITGIWVAQGLGQVTQRRFVPLASSGVAVIALGTVESTRLALQTFEQSLSWRAAQRMGQNLLAHLRSNFTIRVPRAAIPNMPPVPMPGAGAAQQLLTEVSALFVKSRTNLQGRDRYFHLQVTASGASPGGRNSEAQLFRKVPDLDQLDQLRRSSNSHVVITLRGIGEMSPRNPRSFIGRNPQSLYFDRPRASVAMGDAQAYAAAVEMGNPPPQASAETRLDASVWQAMDQLADEVALMFTAGQPFEILTNDGGTLSVPAGATAADLAQLYPHRNRRDGLGTTHHEAGTLRMGDNVADAVTDGFGRIHDTTNCFVASPALFPSSGSPNPMLTGVALARRTGDFLSRRLVVQPAALVLPKPIPFAGSGPGWQVLFDGTLASFNNWSFVGSASGADNQPACGFRYIDGQIITVGAGDFGLLYYPQSFSNFTLRLQFRVFDFAANSGVFVRIRNPRLPLPPAIQARAASDLQQFNNRAWTAVHSGFEVQIDDVAQGDSRVDFYGIRPEPSGLRKNRTGAVYKIPAADPIPGTAVFDRADQTYSPGPTLQPLPWSDPNGWFQYEIQAQGDTYEVRLARVGQALTRTTRFVNTDAVRGVAAALDANSGFIGLQAYSNKRVAFRNIELEPLP
jgi:choline dehydrogenase-like flavoprotein